MRAIPGHNSSEAQMQAKKKHLDVELTLGNIKPCLACVIEKAKQTNVPKTMKEKTPTDRSKHPFLDLLTLTTRRQGSDHAPQLVHCGEPNDRAQVHRFFGQKGMK